MKKTHIVMLVLIVIAITVLISYTGNLSSYTSIATAKQHDGKFVNLIAKLDKTQPLQYDALKDPNYLAFTVVDSLGSTVKVVYHNTKPADMEKSERIVLKGRMAGDHFECKDILLKCPSKYKDDVGAASKSVQASAAENGYNSADSAAAKK